MFSNSYLLRKLRMSRWWRWGPEDEPMSDDEEYQIWRSTILQFLSRSSQNFQVFNFALTDLDSVVYCLCFCFFFFFAVALSRRWPFVRVSTPHWVSNETLLFRRNIATQLGFGRSFGISWILACFVSDAVETETFRPFRSKRHDILVLGYCASIQCCVPFSWGLCPLYSMQSEEFKDRKSVV